MSELSCYQRQSSSFSQEDDLIETVFETTPVMSEKQLLSRRAAMAKIAILGIGLVLSLSKKNLPQPEIVELPPIPDIPKIQPENSIRNTYAALNEIVNPTFEKTPSSSFAAEMQNARTRYLVGTSEKFIGIEPSRYRYEESKEIRNLLNEDGDWHVGSFALELASMAKVPFEIKIAMLGEEGYMADFYIPHTYKPNEPIHYRTDQDFTVGFYWARENKEDQEYLITINNETYKINGPNSYLARPEFGRLTDNIEEIIEEGETGFYKVSMLGEEEMSESQIKDFAWRENSFRALMKYVTDIMPDSIPSAIGGE